MGVDKRMYPNGFRSTPGNTIGIGNPTIPIGKSRGDIGNTGKDFHSKDYWYGVGSEPLSNK